MCRSLYTSVWTRLRHPTTSGEVKKGKIKQFHRLFYIPILPTSWSTEFTQTVHRNDNAGTSALAKSCLYHPGKVSIDPTLNSLSVTEVLLFSSFHQKNTCWKSARTQKGFKWLIQHTLHNHFTWNWKYNPDNRRKLSGMKSRAAQSSSSTQLCKTNSKTKPPPNKKKLSLGQL